MRHPTLADRINKVEGSVKSDQLVSLTNQELLDELQEQGVCSVQRLASRNPAHPNPSIRLAFVGKTLPQAVVCGYTLVPVSPWVPGPPQCRNCWQVGRHGSKLCRQRLCNYLWSLLR